MNNPFRLVTKQDLKDFYNKIKPYLGYEEMDDSDMDDVVTPLPSYSGGSSNPTGTIISFMGIYAPDGYLACDGSTYNIADYPRLANFFLVQFGSVNNFGGDGTTTFAVPDLQGEFLRGTGTNSHTQQGSGADVGVHQNATVIPLSRGVESSTSIEVSRGNTTNYDRAFLNGDNNLKTTGTVGSSAYSYTTRPTNTSVLFCIKD